MKRKILVSLAACSAVVLAFSSIGATQAALTYLSDDYLAQIDLKSIGVTLTENGEDISWRDYRHRDDSWSEATGELLGKLLETAGDDKIIRRSWQSKTAEPLMNMSGLRCPAIGLMRKVVRKELILIRQR